MIVSDRVGRHTRCGIEKSREAWNKKQTEGTRLERYLVTAAEIKCCYYQMYVNTFSYLVNNLAFRLVKTLVRDEARHNNRILNDPRV